MNEEDEDDEIITDDAEQTIEITKEECIALLKECRYSWFSYENPVARSLISRIMKFADE